MTAQSNEIAAVAKMTRSPIIGSPDILDRIKGAKERLQDGHALMRVPVDPTDPDCVLADAELEIERLRALLSASKPVAVQDDDWATGREVIEPLEEPVTIAKALLGGRVAKVGGNEKETTAFLVNIQLAPWGSPKEWVEGFVDGFNRAAKWMQSALTDRAAAQPAQTERALTDAARDIIAERRRQTSVEGWTPEHDDEHANGDMALAAACYAASAGGVPWSDDVPSFWPWADQWWKPTSSRRDLVKAGALILAEIDRIDRAAQSKVTKAGEPA